MDVFKNNFSYRVIFTVDALCIVSILAIQGCTLSYFFSTSLTSRIVFVLMDIICICSFLFTMMISFNYFTQSTDVSETDFPIIDKFKKQLQKVDLGVLPMSYSFWMLYSIFLIGKLNLIMLPFEHLKAENLTSLSGCVDRNSTFCKFIESFGYLKWQKMILQVCLALAVPVFMLLIEGHNWHRRSSTSYSYITDMCKKAGIEIFDSVEMFTLLMDRDDMSSTVESIVFQLVSLNFIMPTLLLYQLNITNFGVKISRTSFRISILHNILRIAVINIPFFLVRFYTCTKTKEISVFIMKNIFYIVLSLRELYIDIWLYLKPVIPVNKSENEEIPLNQNEGTQTDGSRMNAKL